MIIKKQKDDTVSFRGLAFDILDYLTKALHIKYIFKNYSISKWINKKFDVKVIEFLFPISCSYEYVFVRSEDIRMFGGSGPAQANMIENNVNI